MPNFMPGPTRVVFEIDQTNPNIRRAIIASSATSFVFETRGPIILPAILAHILNNTATSTAARQEIQILFSLWIYSRRAQQYVWHVRDRVPPEYQAMAYQAMAYQAIGKTMFRRDGSVVQARTYNYITNLSGNALDKLLSRLVPLFRTTTGHQDVVVRCRELDNVLVGFGVAVHRRWGVYLTTHQSRQPQLRFGGGLPLQQLDAALGHDVVLRHSAWAFERGQLRHTVPTNSRSAPVSGGLPEHCASLSARLRSEDMFEFG